MEFFETEILRFIKDFQLQFTSLLLTLRVEKNQVAII